MEREDCIDTIALLRPQDRFGLPPWMTSVFRTLGRWIDRSRQRHHLAQLDDAALKDIGLSRADVWTEIDKPFWRP
ncbi:MAG: DUF1127 domain-containing protein [Alphaproteobacteria bacterium]